MVRRPFGALARGFLKLHGEIPRVALRSGNAHRCRRERILLSFLGCSSIGVITPDRNRCTSLKHRYPVTATRKRQSRLPLAPLRGSRPPPAASEWAGEKWRKVALFRGQKGTFSLRGATASQYKSLIYCFYVGGLFWRPRVREMSGTISETARGTHRVTSGRSGHPTAIRSDEVRCFGRVFCHRRHPGKRGTALRHTRSYQLKKANPGLEVGSTGSARFGQGSSNSIHRTSKGAKSALTPACAPFGHAVHPLTTRRYRAEAAQTMKRASFERPQDQERKPRSRAERSGRLQGCSSNSSPAVGFSRSNPLCGVASPRIPSGR